MTNWPEDPQRSPSTIRKGQLVPMPERHRAGLIRSVLFCDLQPLPKPEVDVDFPRMSLAERTIESLRYNLALLEYRLGNNGWLRAWVLSTLRVLVFLLVPLVAIMVLIAALVPAAAGLAQVLSNVESASKSMFWAVVYITLALVVVASVISMMPILLRLLRSGRK